jgi:hypothetical protein
VSLKNEKVRCQIIEETILKLCFPARQVFQARQDCGLENKDGSYRMGGTSPTVREGSLVQQREPSLTVGLMPHFARIVMRSVPPAIAGGLWIRQSHRERSGQTHPLSQVVLTSFLSVLRCVVGLMPRFL